MVWVGPYLPLTGIKVISLHVPIDIPVCIGAKSYTVYLFTHIYDYLMHLGIENKTWEACQSYNNISFKLCQAFFLPKSSKFFLQNFGSNIFLQFLFIWECFTYIYFQDIFCWFQGIFWLAILSFYILSGFIHNDYICDSFRGVSIYNIAKVLYISICQSLLLTFPYPYTSPHFSTSFSWSPQGPPPFHIICLYFLLQNYYYFGLLKPYDI